MMLVTSSRYDNDPSRDMTWRQVGPANWSAVEINLSIVTACLPLMRPVVRRVKRLIYGPNAVPVRGASISLKSGSCNLERISSPPACHVAESSRTQKTIDDESYEDFIYGQGVGPKTCIRCGSRHNSGVGSNRENLPNFIKVTNELDLEVSQAV